MSKITLQASELKQLLDSVQEPIVEVKRIDAPFTTVQNRAKMVDLSQDLKVRFGIDRVITQNAILLPDESGPNGEPIYKPVNDKFDQVRLIGPFKNEASSYGHRVSAPAGSSIEITFYGTGLNCMLLPTYDLTSYTYELDGGAAQQITATNFSDVLGGRLYEANTVFNIVKGLTLGLHTIKITSPTAPVDLMGYEVINESSQLLITKGAVFKSGNKIQLSSNISSTYNSGFDSSSDALGTKGGRVSVYLNEDGTIGKAFKAVDTSIKYGSQADHSNEEVIRTLYPRNFGVSRADDFTISPTSSGAQTNTTFTLSDGVTNLTSDNFQNGFSSSERIEYITQAGNGNQFFFTFVGTGLDIRVFNALAATPLITVDGVSVSMPTTNSSGTQILKVVSGLPYGSHVVAFTRSSNINESSYINKFIVYGPKKPAIPTNSVELCEYFLSADYAQPTGTSSNNVKLIANGVLRRDVAREFSYVGSSWTLGLDMPNSPSGIQLTASTNSDYVEYTFWGTGFEYRSTASTSRGNIEVSLNGQLLTSTNFPTIAGNTGVYGSNDISFNESTGILDWVSSSTIFMAGFFVYNLPLGLYTVRFKKLDGSVMNISNLDIISPTISENLNKNHIANNNLYVGASNLSDKRVFSDLIIPKYSNTVIGYGKQNTHTVGTTLVPVKEMLAPIHLSKDASVRISFQSIVRNSAGGLVNATIYVDGYQVKALNAADIFRQYSSSSSDEELMTFSLVLPLSRGHHIIYVLGSVNSGSGLFDDFKRLLIVEEI